MKNFMQLRYIFHNKLLLPSQPARNYSHCCLVNRPIIIDNNRTTRSNNAEPKCFNVELKHTLIRESCDFIKHLNAREFSYSAIRFAKGRDRGKDKKSPTKTKLNADVLAEVLDVQQVNSQMEKAIEDLRNNYIKNLTLRSSLGSIEQIVVSWEGKDYTMQELAQIARKPKVLVLNVSAFPQVIPKILQAISKSGMNLNPQQDGTTIFIPIPKVTKEHRENLSKNAKSLFIRCRDTIKDIQNKHIKALKRKDNVSQDVVRSAQNEVQTIGDNYVVEAEKIFEAKQKELLGASD